MDISNYFFDWREAIEWENIDDSTICFKEILVIVIIIKGCSGGIDKVIDNKWAFTQWSWYWAFLILVDNIVFICITFDILESEWWDRLYWLQIGSDIGLIDPIVLIISNFKTGFELLDLISINFDPHNFFPLFINEIDFIEFLAGWHMQGLKTS